MGLIEHLFHALKTRILSLYLRFEFRAFSFLGKPEKIFSLKRGRMLLPLSPRIKDNARRFEVYEPHTDDILRQYIKPGMTVIECGANDGYFTVLISRLISPTGKCYSFEPFPKYIRFLLKNLELNQITNVQHVPKAVGKVSGTIRFSDEDQTSYGGINSIWDFQPKKEVKIKKNVTRDIIMDVIVLSEFISQNDLNVDFIFLDIEGCEKPVFDELLSSLKDNALPIIYFESHKGLYGDNLLSNIFGQFKNRGFSKSTITNSHFLMIPPHRRDLIS